MDIRQVEGPRWYPGDPWVWSTWGIGVWVHTSVRELASRRPVGWIRRPGIWAGVDTGGRAGTSVHVLVNLRSVTCVPSLMTFYLYQPERRRGLGFLQSCFMWVLKARPVEGSALPVAACVASRVAFCVCLHACTSVCLWDTYLTLHGLTCKRESSSLGRRPVSLWAGSQQLGRRESQACNCCRRTQLRTSLNIFIQKGKKNAGVLGAAPCWKTY